MGTPRTAQHPLRQYVTHGKPFGPTDAGVVSVEDRLAVRRLFDPQNKIYEALALNPALIIGRRGSGKTAYLHSIFIADEFAIVQEAKTSETFAQVVSAIEKGTSSYYLAENIAQLWDELFHFALISEVARQYRDTNRELRLIDDYVSKHDLRGKNSVDSFLWKVVKVLGAKSGGSLVGAVAEVIKEVSGLEYEAAKTLTADLLQSKNHRAILLLDSLEQYPMSIQSVAKALSGLLMCVGQFNQRNPHFNVRLCLPAELYHVFLDHVSSNPLKDFSSQITLHWVARELLSVAAHRLWTYLELYFPAQVAGATIDWARRDHIHEFFAKYLPVSVTNGFGTTEDTLAYILRHTQLQPRHLLMYLNTIFDRQRTLSKDKYPQISEQAVIEGIRVQEHQLAQEVFSGYFTLYPNARKVCEACIPELPIRFSNGELQRVFNRHGKKASASNEYGDFKRLLIETGIVGRVTGETDRYVVGRFEYTEPHKLIVSLDDELCLHPVFASVFNFKRRGTQKTVYPYGCDPNAEDYRNWQFESRQVEFA